MENEDSHNPFADCEVISSYSRSEAIEDGVLVDVSKLAKEAGFRYPMAVTRAVYGILDPSPELQRDGQSFSGRAWDMLTILRVAIRSARDPGEEIHFSPLFIRKTGGNPEPVITILLPAED